LPQPKFLAYPIGGTLGKRLSTLVTGCSIVTSGDSEAFSDGNLREWKSNQQAGY
jgi:hypothetical protein